LKDTDKKNGRVMGLAKVIWRGIELQSLVEADDHLTAVHVAVTSVAQSCLKRWPQLLEDESFAPLVHALDVKSDSIAEAYKPRPPRR
jgi:hypothetical protein